LKKKREKKINPPNDDMHSCCANIITQQQPCHTSMPCHAMQRHLYASQGLSDPAGRCNQQSHSTGAIINSLRSLAHCTADRDPRTYYGAAHADPESPIDDGLGFGYKKNPAGHCLLDLSLYI
jgi:hypothetical protein